MTAAAARTSALVVRLAQLGWVALIPLHPPVAVWLPAYLVLFALEVGGPWAVDRTHGRLPWHAHHIAERYGLLVIIALGEGVVGTVVSTQSLIQTQGWSVAAAVLAVGGVTLTMGMWWIYFAAPFGLAARTAPGPGAQLHLRPHPPAGRRRGRRRGSARRGLRRGGRRPPHAGAGRRDDRGARRRLLALGTLALPPPGAGTGPRARRRLAGRRARARRRHRPRRGGGPPSRTPFAVVVLAPWVNVVGYETVGHRAVTDNLRRVAAGSPGSDAHG